MIGTAIGQMRPVPKDNIKTSEPPQNFVDNTVYRYRLLPDGTKEPLGTMEAFPAKVEEEERRIPVYSDNGAKGRAEYREKQRRGSKGRVNDGRELL